MNGKTGLRSSEEAKGVAPASVRFHWLLQGITKKCCRVVFLSHSWNKTSRQLKRCVGM